MKVIAKQQSPVSDEATEIVWTGGAGPADEVSVMLAVAQLLQHAKDEAPFSPTLLEVRIEF